MLLRAQRSLADFLRTEMARRDITSTYELGRRIGVSQGTAWRLLSSSRVPREETLVKIAGTFGVDITDVREMAERPAGEIDHFRLPPEADQLDNRERDAVVEMIWVILAARAERRVTR